MKHVRILLAAVALGTLPAAAPAGEPVTGLKQAFDAELTPETAAAEAVATPKTVLEAQFDATFAEDRATPGQPLRAIGAGTASWYGPKFAGRRTASGERFNPGQLTAAHRTLPFGSRVKVTHQRTGRSVIVRINDRGPFAHNRVIDLSEAAARQIGIVGPGHGTVELALIDS